MSTEDSLLRWGIANAQPGSLTQVAAEIKDGKRPDLNSDMLKHIMGKSDADRMLECMQVIEHPSSDESVVNKDDRLVAWEDLEMLVQDIDNANDLKNMKLWPPIVKHLRESEQDSEIVLMAAWVSGTAVQNNPKAKEAFLELDPLPSLLHHLSTLSTPTATRQKAMYCLSSTLSHSPTALARFKELDGFSILGGNFVDPSAQLRSKTAFLISALFLASTDEDTDKGAGLLKSTRDSGALKALLSALSKADAVPTGPNGDATALDPTFRETGLLALYNIWRATDGALDAEEKGKIKTVLQEAEEEAVTNDDLGLSSGEWTEFTTAFGA